MKKFLGALALLGCVNSWADNISYDFERKDFAYDSKQKYFVGSGVHKNELIVIGSAKNVSDVSKFEDNYFKKTCSKTADSYTSLADVKTNIGVFKTAFCSSNKESSVMAVYVSSGNDNSFVVWNRIFNSEMVESKAGPIVNKIISNLNFRN